MINKEEASKLELGKTIYYLGLNYIVQDCRIVQVIPNENGTVELEFDDGCVEVVDDNGRPYLFLTKKDALEAAEHELNGMLEMINKQRENLTN